MARYGTAIPKIYCIPGMLAPIHENNTRATTAANGKVYFIDHSLALNENDNIMHYDATRNQACRQLVSTPAQPVLLLLPASAEAQAESVRI